jgi:16S rRNA (uracil1498-N3)-methyltransferase
MRLIRIHCPGPLLTGSAAILPPLAANHVSRVLRLRAGAPLVVFDGIGSEFHAEVTSVAHGVSITIGDRMRGTPESPLKITLVQGVSRSERMDWALQKATELGVTTIAPVLTARSVVRLDDKQSTKKLEHWRNIVVGACEQCGRNLIPQILEPVSFRDYVAQSPKQGLRLVLSPTASTSLAGLNSMPNKVELLIGPEGGLDDDEIARAEAAGFVPVTLGPRVLRTETAAITALSVLQALWGDLV